MGGVVGGGGIFIFFAEGGDFFLEGKNFGLKIRWFFDHKVTRYDKNKYYGGGGDFIEMIKWGPFFCDDLEA